MLPSPPAKTVSEDRNSIDNEDWEDEDESSPPLIGEDVEAILRRQDEAMELLLRLRSEEPFDPPRGSSENADMSGKGRRDFRRWPMPRGLAVERHDGTIWSRLTCLDIGVGGVRIATDAHSDAGDDGPFPLRLRLQEPETTATPPSNGNVIVLGDVMWRRGTGSDGQAGVRFEFLDNEERDYWNDALIDALLAAQALQ